jgi:hypothetical protein
VKYLMPHRPLTEELLRADLLAASKSLDAAREAIAANQLTKEEEKLIHAAARSRYATALRRFSDLVVDGKVPPD